MTKILLILAACTLIWSGSAFAIPFTMINEGSDNVSSIQADVIDIANGARVSIDVSGGPIVADITGVFFDLTQFVVPGLLTIGLPSTQDEGNVRMAPNNANMGGNVPGFDVGVAIGNVALTDDFQTIAFDILGIDLDATDFTRLGVRLQSVGQGDGRTGSAKYVGGPAPAPVPEPATMLLLGTGLVGLAGFGRKRIAKK